MFIKEVFDCGALIVEHVAEVTLLICCTLEALDALGFKKMCFEVCPRLVGVRFLIPGFAFVKVEATVEN